MARQTKQTGPRYWSHRVMQTSNALDLDVGVFKLRTPRRIAASLKRSAERSHRRKSDPYRSAMSMLTFYINRGGKKLAASRKKVLENAKKELRTLFGRSGLTPRAGGARGAAKRRTARPRPATRARARAQRK
jgi:hypothetical protein